jgi:FkbH-like protein
MEAILRDERYIGLYGKLSDRFGDNGLISIVLGRRELDVLHLDLWLMSCRVLKRDMELAMLDVLVEHARAKSIATLRGYYLPTKKNGMVADHYEKLGFERISLEPDSKNSVWTLDLQTYTPRNRHIRLLEPVHG